MDKEELIGQIIDIFEDNLKERNAGVFTDKEDNSFGLVNLYKEDEDCKGVFFGGKNYDDIALKLKSIFLQYRIKRSNYCC